MSDGAKRSRLKKISIPVSTAKTFEDIRYAMKHRYGVTFDSSMKDLPIEAQQRAAQGVENVLKHFPAVKDILGQKSSFYPESWQMSNGLTMSAVSGAEIGGANADCDLMGAIRINADSWKDQAQYSINRQYGMDIGFYAPSSADADGTTSHETGHVLIAALIGKEVQAGRMSVSQGAASWTSRDPFDPVTFPAQIVEHAQRQLPKSDPIRNMSVADAARTVSGYGGKYSWETIAECVTECAGKGEAARPLSKAVWKTLQDLLR